MSASWDEQNSVALITLVNKEGGLTNYEEVPAHHAIKPSSRFRHYEGLDELSGRLVRMLPSNKLCPNVSCFPTSCLPSIKRVLVYGIDCSKDVEFYATQVAARSDCSGHLVHRELHIQLSLQHTLRLETFFRYHRYETVPSDAACNEDGHQNRLNQKNCGCAI